MLIVNLCEVLNRCSPKSRDELVNNLLPDAGELLQDNFGCYVLQKIIETVHSSQLGELMNEHIVTHSCMLSLILSGKASGVVSMKITERSCNLDVPWAGCSDMNFLN